MKEWQEYAVGKPSTTPNWTEPDCRPFETVSHVAHIDDAFRIFEDNEVRPSLIFDESKLKTTRISVSWLSPNTWADGSRYGNVSYEFNWKKLIEGKNFYWVEAIKYGITAVRILVTEQEPVVPLPRYHPEKGDGPVFHDLSNDTWYRNGRYTAEFMFDGTLPLDECETVSFVNHHERYCNKGGCENKGKEGYKCGAKLMARLISQEIISPQRDHLGRLFCESGHNRIRLHDDAARAWAYVIRSFSVEGGGTVDRKHPATLYLATAILDRFGTGRKTRKLCDLFENRNELRWSLRERARRAFNMDSADDLEREDE
jgi:hypothetical protein